MEPDLPIKPFRWNLAKREQIGDLSHVARPETYPGYAEDVRAVAGRVVARAGDSDLVFVGRSPECLFDYLSGLMEGVDDAPSLTLLQFSAPFDSVDTLAKRHRAELDALLDYFIEERIDPKSIASYGKQVRFVDLVSSGQTFGRLVQYLEYWSRTQAADWNVVQRRIGFVGITRQKHTSPNTWRWWQQQAWVAEIPKTPITNVSAPDYFWRLVANSEEKATPSHWLDRWASPAALEPRRDDVRLRGLRLALENYDRGRDREERARFVRELTQLPEMRDGWLRSLVLRLRGVA